MENYINQRYVLIQPIFPISMGMLYIGKDLPLQRNVVIYIVDGLGTIGLETYFKMVTEVSHFSDNRFLHVLDVGIDRQRVFAVLKSSEGKPLAQILHHMKYTTIEILKMVFELGLGLQDAMEEGISSFSICVRNIWISDEGCLQIINYWEKAADSKRGARGLGILLYQLLSRSEDEPVSIEQAQLHLRSFLRKESTEFQDAIISFIGRSLKDQEFLSSFMLDLQNILKHQAADVSDAAKVETIVDNEMDMEPETDDEVVESEQQKRSLFKPGKKTLIASLAVVVFTVTFIFIASMPPKNKNDETASSGSTNNTSITDPRLIGTKNPTKDESIIKASQDSMEIVIMPNLIGLSQGEAEKQALSLGLHYSYFLEANVQAKGTVFRQEPAPGTKIAKGEDITFWVSKGD